MEVFEAEVSGSPNLLKNSSKFSKMRRTYQPPVRINPFHSVPERVDVGFKGKRWPNIDSVSFLLVRVYRFCVFRKHFLPLFVSKRLNFSTYARILQISEYFLYDFNLWLLQYFHNTFKYPSRGVCDKKIYVIGEKYISKLQNNDPRSRFYVLTKKKKKKSANESLIFLSFWPIYNMRSISCHTCLLVNVFIST